MTPSVTLDTGALIGIERGTDEADAGSARRGRSSRRHVQHSGGSSRSGPARFLKLSNVSVVALDEVGARAVGVLCARGDVNDIVDASVVICAKLADDPVVTTDPDDLRRVNPKLRIVAI